MTVAKKTSTVVKLRKTMAAAGISAAMLLAGVAFAMRTTRENVVDPYIRNIVRCEFDSLNAPFEKQLNDVVYDSKLTRNILEGAFPDSLVKKAKQKTEDTVWRVK